MRMLYKSSIDSSKLASMLWDHLETLKDKDIELYQRTKDLVKVLQNASFEAGSAYGLAHSLSIKGCYEEKVDFFTTTAHNADKYIQEGKDLLYEIALGTQKKKMKKHH